MNAGPVPPVPTEPIFTRISRRYDLLNRVLSLGMDRAWRRRMAGAFPPSARLLDVACGTGDVIEEGGKRGAVAVGLDPTLAMLLGARNRGMTRLSCGQAEILPFRNGVFDCASCAFGVRNFADLERGLTEIHRVIRAGGRIVILEFDVPDNRSWKFLFRIYRLVIPLAGALLAGSAAAYGYLSRSIDRFGGIDLEASLEQAGFNQPIRYTILGGIVQMVTAEKGEPHGCDT